MKNLKKLSNKAVKNTPAIKGGGNGSGTRKSSAQAQNTQLELL